MNQWQTYLIPAMIASIAISALSLHYFKQQANNEVIKTEDKKSILAFRILYPGSIIASAVFYYYDLGYLKFLDTFLFHLMSVLLFISGMLIRWIAILSLRKRFTVKVTILKEHRLKTNGIYSLVRHPSYTGLLLYYLGLGLAMHNIICIFLLYSAVIPVIIFRIKIEEATLIDHFKNEYQKYKINTYKLIPWIY